MGVGIRMGNKGGPIVDAIFGDASLGNVHITADTNLSSMFPNFAEDTGVFELNCKDFTLDSGKTLIADKRNAGVIIRCKGNCTISGSILNNLAPKTLLAEAQAIVESKYPSWLVDNGAGGNGGSPSGAGMDGRFYGGGIGGGAAGGGASTYNGSANGGAGGSSQDIKTNTPDVFVGGSSRSKYSKGELNGLVGTNGGGGSGAVACNGSTTSDHHSGAGASGAGSSGGNAYVRYPTMTWELGGGGGAGNYGGGVVIIICRGKLTISGTLNCNGRNGGAGGIAWDGSSTSGWNAYNGGAGGNGGGGRIYLLYNKHYINTGSCLVNSGGGTQGTAGTAGDKHYTTYRNYKAGNEPTDIP